MPVIDLQRQLGLLRSLCLYYGVPLRRRRLIDFYAQFIGPDTLCFDIGAHVGSRLRVWLTLGARIVALEPQAQCMQLLRRWYGDQSRVTLIEAAVGANSGTGTLFVSRRTPTVTTLSAPWIKAVSQDPGFSWVRWEDTQTVPIVTLDELIERYGEPAFCKIDVEGSELDVLKGLTRPIGALSFEYISAYLEAARHCIDRLEDLGEYEYNWSRGESQQLRSSRWLSAKELGEQFEMLKAEAKSGDIYARRRTA